MHSIQRDLLSLSRNINLADRSLRDIGKLIGVEHPEKIRHHLKQLEKKGFLIVDKTTNSVKNVNPNRSKENKFINVPIVGSANCGPAEILAIENIEGYLTTTSSLVGKGELYALRAKGDSMNRANIKGMSISEGDYVIVDRSKNHPENGDYVVVVLDQAAMIKKFHTETEQGAIYFVSESTSEHPPIVISGEDLSDVFINGTVVSVVKDNKNLSLQE